MKPNAVTSIVFIEDEARCHSSSSSFLLQGAIHFAEQGYSVCVISMNEVQSLPPPLHGVIMPGADVFSLIRFVYLSKWQDLLQHLYAIHNHAQVPSVLVLDSVEKYFTPKINTSNTEVNEEDIDDQHAALICASLIDAAAVCAEKLKKQAFLLLSIKQSAVVEPTLNTILNTFFTDFKWFIKSEQPDGDHSERKVIFTSHNNKHVFTFSLVKDTAFYLREVITLSINS